MAMEDSVPPPRVHESALKPGIKSILDVLAEVDDWFAKEISSSDAWGMPAELLNLEQKREIFRIAIRDGIWEACLLALVTPFICGIVWGKIRPFPELGSMGMIIGLIILAWPYFLLPLFPLKFIRKIRGSITRLICWELTVGRAVGLILGSWVLAACFLCAPWAAEFLFPPGSLPGYLSPLLFDPLYYLQGTYSWLAAASLYSGLVPVIAIVTFTPRVQKKWDEIQVLVRGIV